MGQPKNQHLPTKNVSRKAQPVTQVSALQRIEDEHDCQRALAAYMFWYPIVAMEHGADGYCQQGILESRSANIFSARPNHMLMTGATDMPYLFVFIDLKNGPIRIELPAGPFIANVMDYNECWLLDMGLPGPDKGKGGKYIIVPPDCGTPIPEGHRVAHSATSKILIDIRILPSKRKPERAIKALKKTRIRSLTTGEALQLIDFTANELHLIPYSWQDNIEYWHVLHKIVDREPVTERLSPMYHLLRTLGIEKGRPFEPDARMETILEKAEKDGRYQIRDRAKGDRPDRFPWMDRRWKWIQLLGDVTHLKQLQGTELSLNTRALASSKVNLPILANGINIESQYWLGFRDSQGAFLDGGKTYQLIVPHTVSGQLAWSVTIYDAGTRREISTERAELRSWVDTLLPEDDGSVKLFFGPVAPNGREDQWIPTLPGQTWYSYFRVYASEKTLRERNWEPGDVTEVNYTLVHKPTNQ
jgi:hypothetical protein